MSKSCCNKKSVINGRSLLFCTLVVFILIASTLIGIAWGVEESSRELRERIQKRQAALPFRTPPLPARRACEDKKEGDPCDFISARGHLEGICMSGRENIFACRPNRNEQEQPSPQSPQTEPKQELKPSSPDTEKIPALPVQTLQPKGPPTVQRPDENQSLSPERTPSSDQHHTDIQPAAIHERFSWQLPEVLIGSHLFVAFLSAAATWYAFFTHSTLPLRRLRTVTQRLAQGDISARVGEGLVQRKDEVADLARDVDRMAERIEGLVNAHQRLVRDVSHELRSPLARLNVALELARQTAGPDLAAPFDRIDRESERLNELIAQLLMLTKLENDSSSMQHQQLDLAALITEIAHDVDFEASSKGRRVTATASEPLLLDANRELLRQALENLIRNAARYTAQDTSVEVTLRCRSVGGRNWAHIEVRDYGPGVPESELYDIFRPFYRVNDARERQSGGSGVGLAIADRAVRLHGGSLRAFNAPGGGLVMELELPIT